MSVEQIFTSKLTLDTALRKSSGTLSTSPTPSQQSSQQQQSSTIVSPKPFLTKGSSFTFGKRDKSPHRPLERVDSVDVEVEATSKQQHSSPPPTHTVSVDRTQSVKLTRKILHNWKSACGTKTKDLFRRWKTLPEDHPDFDNIPSTYSGSSTSSAVGEPKGSRSNIPGTTSTSIHHRAESPHGGTFARPKSAGNNEKKGSGTDFSALNQSFSQEDKNKGWSVHVWATYVQRGSTEDDGLSNGEEEPPPRTSLSEFQKVKLTYFFHQVLDANKDDLISASDFMALNQRIRHYIEWSGECIEFHILKEVHSGFLECFLNQPLDDCSHMFYSDKDKDKRDYVNVDEWLDIWGELLHSARNLQSLPLWLQYFPKILFQVINKSGSGTITREELRAFYTSFLGIDFRVVNDTVDIIYRAMTDENRSKLNYATFKLCFANFLFAKYPHGPGQYLFGICSPQSLTTTFPIDYSALNTPPADMQPYDPERDKKQCNRRSVIV